MAFGLPGYAAGQRLTSFIDDHVRPTHRELESLGQAVDEVVRFLHNFDGSFPGKDYRISRVVKSGSLGKGTAVQNRMDVDLVVFMARFSTMASFLAQLPTLLADLARYIQSHGSLSLLSRNEYMMKCQLRHGGRMHDVDILPAVDLLAYGGRQAVYAEMGQQRGSTWEGPQSHYSVCLAELQRDFVKSKADGDSRIKDLIRLVKYWSKTQGLATVSYCLELVCIKVYQECGANATFDMTRLFKLVMEKLSNMSSLGVNFNDYYNSGTYSSQWSAPFVMDPANPYNNTLPRGSADRQGVAAAAAQTLQGRAVNESFNFCPRA